MNNLKFIEKLIKDYKDSKERFLDNLKKYPNDEVFIKCIKTREQELQQLEQIKIKLEAWEVCKEFIVNLGGEYEMSIDNYYNVNEYQTLKKALEVKENEQNTGN